jgi:hypothetical protein
VQDPDDHIPGEGRIMTGAVLTEAGRVAAEQKSRSEKRLQAERRDDPALNELAKGIRATLGV